MFSNNRYSFCLFFMRYETYLQMSMPRLSSRDSFSLIQKTRLAGIERKCVGNNIVKSNECNANSKWIQFLCFNNTQLVPMRSSSLGNVYIMNISINILCIHQTRSISDMSSKENKKLNGNEDSHKTMPKTKTMRSNNTNKTSRVSVFFIFYCLPPCISCTWSGSIWQPQ